MNKSNFLKRLGGLVIIIVLLYSPNVGGTAAGAAVATPYGTLASINSSTALGEDQALLVPLVTGSAGQTQVFTQEGVNGQHATVHLNAAVMTTITGTRGVTTLVGGAPQSSVYTTRQGSVVGSQSSDHSTKEQLLAAVEKSKTIPVIVRLQNTAALYEGSPSKRTAATRKDTFNQKRNRVLSVAGGAGTTQHRADLPIIGAIALTVDAAALTQLLQNPDVARVDFDDVATATLDESLNAIGARTAWSRPSTNNTSLTGTGTRVAIVDTGVDYTHPDLGGCLGTHCKVIGGYDFVNNDQDPMDDQGHGTHVASTAAGDGLLQGVAPDAKILAYKALDAYGNGLYSNIIQAIDFATDPNRDGDPADHVDVGNMSLGGPGDGTDPLSLAVDQSSNAGVLWAVAAGNSGPQENTIGTPGNSATAITVAAACKPSQQGVLPNGVNCGVPVAGFSSQGRIGGTKPDVAAPGVLICAARWQEAFAGQGAECFDSHHIRISGTSMATPHVAGAALLVKQAHPDLTPGQIKEAFKNTAQDLGLPSHVQGKGLIKLDAAVGYSQPLKPAPAVWEVHTSPSVATSTHVSDLSFSRSASPQTYTFDTTGLPNGVHVNLNAPQITLGNNASAIIRATLTVDNNVAKAGTYWTQLKIVQGGVVVQVLPIHLVVTPTVQIDPGSLLDFGVDAPTLSNFTGSSTITLTNLRSDISQQITVLASNVPNGVSLQLPSSVSLLPGQSKTITVTLQVNNQVVPNAVYASSLVFATATQEKEITAKFTKYFVLKINNPNGDLFTGGGAYVWVHNRRDLYIVQFPVSRSVQLYFNQPDVFDIRAQKVLADNYGLVSYSVTREGVAVTNGITEVTLSRAEAQYLIQHTPKDHLGNSSSPAALYLSDYLVGNSAFHIGSSTTGGGMREYYSSLSPAYAHESIATLAAQPASVLEYHGATLQGIQSSVQIENDPTHFKATTIPLTADVPGRVMTPLLSLCLFPTATYVLCLGDTTPATLTAPFSQTVYWDVDRSVDTAYQSDLQRRLCAATVPCATAFYTPYWSLGTGARRFFQPGSFPLYTFGTELPVGYGPPIWTGMTDNTSSSIRVLNAVGGLHTPFLRQDYVIQEHGALPYTVTNKSGSTINVGTFEPYRYAGVSLPGQTSSVFDRNLLTVNTGIANLYTLSTSIPYTMDNIDLIANASITMNLSGEDKNPPAIRNFKLTKDGGSTTDRCVPGVAQTLKFGLDPVGGSMYSTRAGYIDRSGNFVDLATTQDPIRPSVKDRSATVNFTSYIPETVCGRLTADVVTFKVLAYDDAKNKLEYSFQLLVGSSGKKE